MRELRVVITRDDLAQFLYPIRSEMARIDRQLEDIGRRLEYMGAHRSRPPGRFTRL